MINAGRLNKRVSLQQRDPTRDAAGQPSNAWVEIASGKAWANVRYLNGREFATSGSEASAATVSVRVRWRTDVTADMRVVFGSTILDIVAVLPDEVGNEYVDLACTTGANDG